MRTFYINIDASSPASALVKNTSGNPPETLPEFVLGDINEFKIYLLDKDGSAVDYTATHTIKAAIGLQAQYPTGGEMILTVAGSAAPIPSIVYNPTAAVLAEYLNDLSQVALEGDVTVAGAFPYYEVTWVTDGAKTPIQCTLNLLTPPSDVILDIITEGDTGVYAKQLVRVNQTPYTIQQTWTDAGAYWTGTLRIDTYQLGAYLYSATTAIKQKKAVFEIEMTRTSDGLPTTILQVDATLKTDVIG